MALKRYWINGGQLSDAELCELDNHIDGNAFIASTVIGKRGQYVVFYEADRNISEISPLLFKCEVVDITQIDM